jgi:hypothetical protein
MTSVTSLFACPAADVTVEGVRDLVGDGQPESVTLEYKQAWTSNLIKSAAGMANSYGA